MSGCGDLVVEPLSRRGFAPFGDVIETDGAEHFTINQGQAERYHDLADIQFAGTGARPVMSIFRGWPVQLPLHITLLERHPMGSQAFVPLQRRPYLIVVAPRGDDPEAAGLRAFWGRASQGVNYHSGVWHHPLLALGEISDFLVIDRAGPGRNCEEWTLARPHRLVVTEDLACLINSNPVEPQK